MRKLKYREVGQFTHSLTPNEWWSWDLSPGSLAPGEGNGTPLQYSCLENPMDGGAWLGCSSSGRYESGTTEWPHFHTLEKEMATHSSVLAWRIPGMGELGGLPSMGSHRVRHDWSDLAVWLQSSMLLTIILCCQPVEHILVGFICHWQLGVDHCWWKISISTDEHEFVGAFAVLCILVSMCTGFAYRSCARGVSSGVSEPDSNASFSTFWWHDCSSSGLSQCLHLANKLMLASDQQVLED